MLQIRPTPTEERLDKWAHAYHSFDASVNTQEQYLHDDQPFQQSRWPAVNLKDYIETSVSVYRICFAMLCGYPPKFFRRHDHGAPLHVLLKIVEWVSIYSDFETMRPQLEQFILHRYAADYDISMYSFPYTHLRIATLIKSESLFQAAMTHALRNFLRVFFADPRKYLLENLGGDAKIAGHVMDMKNKLCALVHETDGELANLGDNDIWGLEWHDEDTSSLATGIWRTWYRQQTNVPSSTTFVMRRFLEEGCAPAAQMIAEFGEHEYAGWVFPPAHLDGDTLLADVEYLRTKAERAAQIMLDKNWNIIWERDGRHWDQLDGLDYEDYRYPWQERAKGKTSKLTRIIEATEAMDRGAEDESEHGDERE